MQQPGTAPVVPRTTNRVCGTSRHLSLQNAMSQSSMSPRLQTTDGWHQLASPSRNERCFESFHARDWPSFGRTGREKRGKRSLDQRTPSCDARIKNGSAIPKKAGPRNGVTDPGYCCGCSVTGGIIGGNCSSAAASARRAIRRASCRRVESLDSICSTPFWCQFTARSF